MQHKRNMAPESQLSPLMVYAMIVFLAVAKKDLRANLIRTYLKIADCCRSDINVE